MVFMAAHVPFTTGPVSVGGMTEIAKRTPTEIEAMTNRYSQATTPVASWRTLRTRDLSNNSGKVPISLCCGAK